MTRTASKPRATAADYEWDVETVAAVESAAHEVGDVIDHDFVNSAAEAIARASETPRDGTRRVIVLVSTTRSGDRSWAYVESGSMPTRFRDAFDRAGDFVPDRFLREWIAARKGPTFAKGDAVHHPSYGDGVVTAELEGDYWRLRCEFLGTGLRVPVLATLHRSELVAPAATPASAALDRFRREDR